VTASGFLAGRARTGRGERSVGWWGLAFVLLLLLSAGMADVPTAQSSTQSVRSFYTAHTGVVVAAQVLGLLAAAAFARFAAALAPTWRRPAAVRRSGLAVALAAALTAGPVLVLAAVAGDALGGTLHAWTLVCDAGDVVLFAAVAAFGVAVATGAPSRVVAAVGWVLAAVAAARAVLLATGSGALGIVAPLLFVGLVAVLAVRGLVRGIVRAR
jgi:hypothetical protein